MRQINQQLRKMTGSKQPHGWRPHLIRMACVILIALAWLPVQAGSGCEAGDAPCAEITPELISIALDPDQSASVPLAIGNTGSVALNWTLASAQPRQQSIMSGNGIVDCESAPGWLVHDDGSVDDAFGANPLSVARVAFVDRFQPTSYPASFQSVCLAFRSDADSLDFEIVVFDDDGPNGGPGTELGSVLAYAHGIRPHPETTPYWQAFDISSMGLVVESGVVYIGARWQPATPNFFLAADRAPEQPIGYAGGYWWTNAINAWGKIEQGGHSFRNYRSMFIRAQEVNLECDYPGSVSWLSVDISSGQVAPGASSQVQVLVDASDLLPGEHRASLCVQSNDPLRSTIRVPIELSVATPPTYTTILGQIQSAGYCGREPAPLSHALITVDTAMSSFTVNADDHGRYALALPSSQGPVDITVTGGGHLPAVLAGLVLEPGSVLSEDFALVLDAPCAQTTPTALAFSLPTEQAGTAALTVDNRAGGASLDWQFSTSALDMPAGLHAAAKRNAECEQHPGLIIHDDGQIDAGFAGHATGQQEVIYVDRFTPGTYQARLEVVCVSFRNSAPVQTNVQFEVVIFADDGPDGSPGTELGSLAATATGIPALAPGPHWRSFDVSSLGVSIDSGSIYVGVRWSPVSRPSVFISVDESMPRPAGFAGGYYRSSLQPEWLSIVDGPATWSQYRSLFVRAAMSGVNCDSPADIPWLDIEPVSGSTEAGEVTAVEILLNAQGLAPGIYRAGVCLGSNDPRTPMRSVPVELTVLPPSQFAEIIGTVRTSGHCSSNAADVPGATVLVEGSHSSQTVTTNAAGEYRVEWDATESPLTITASASSYISETIHDIVVDPGSQVVRNFDLILDQPCFSLNSDGIEVTLVAGEQATDGFVIDNSSGGSELAWSTTIGDPATAEGLASMRFLDCSDWPGLIVHDDGEVNTSFSANASAQRVAFVDRFIPASYPASFTDVCLAFVSGGPTEWDIEIVVFDDDGLDGAPGTELGVLPVTLRDIPPTPVVPEPTWMGFDISALGVSIDSGSVYIGARWRPGVPNLFIGADTSPGNPVGHAGGYWWYQTGSGWSTIHSAGSSFASYRSLFIRAIEGGIRCDEIGAAGWLVATPSEGTIAAGGNAAVALHVDSSGLTPGRHRAGVCVSSNDPHRPLRTVPVTLHVLPAPAPALSFDPPRVDFGEVAVGSGSTSRTVTLRNQGDTAAAGLELVVHGAGDVTAESTCGATLAASDECSVILSFAPSGAGTVGGSLVATGEQAGPALVTFSGSGVPSVSDIAVAIEPLRNYLKRGQLLDYMVTLHNAGPGPAAAVEVASELSESLDTDFSRWHCLAPATSGCTPYGTGELEDAGLSLPIGGVVSYLVSAPVRFNAPDRVTTAVYVNEPGDPIPENDSALAVSQVVILRDGFQLYDEDLSVSDDGELSDGQSRTWQLPQPKAVLETVIRAVRRSEGTASAMFRVERLSIESAAWVRVVKVDDHGFEQAGEWSPAFGDRLRLSLRKPFDPSVGGQGDGAIPERLHEDGAISVSVVLDGPVVYQLWSVGDGIDDESPVD